MKLIALKSMVGSYGRVAPGMEFELDDDIAAKQLVGQGFARPLGHPKVLYDNKAVVPPENKDVEHPFVSALCLTRNRRQWLPIAIQCFLSQSYPNKEMVIVADGEDVSDLVPNDPRIRFVVIEEGFEIGGKRNFSCHIAQGDILMNWDDDDWSAPTRMADQVERLISSGKQVTGYGSMIFKHVKSGKAWLYKAATDFACGTSITCWKSWWVKHPYPAKQVGEDQDFVEVARKAGELISVPAGDQMYATNHSQNTSPRDCGNKTTWEEVTT